VIVDAEVVGDLVEERGLHRPAKTVGLWVRSGQRTAEERDLAGHRNVVHPELRPRNALVEPEEAPGADRRELLGRGIFLDDDGDRPEPLEERGRKAVDDVIDDLVEVDDRFGGRVVARSVVRRSLIHPRTISGGSMRVMGGRSSPRAAFDP
jgi:hypothetical protein